MRRKREIAAAENEFLEKFWYICQLFMKKRFENGNATTAKGVRKKTQKTEENLFKKVGEEAFLPKDEFEWGMVNGKISALHWALGREWDFLGDFLLNKYTSVMRQEWEVFDAQEEYFERVWFGRNTKYILNDEGEVVLVPRHEVGSGMVELLLERYGQDSLTVHSDFEWGVWSGRLSALRWILGDEWDFLDT